MLVPAVDYDYHGAMNVLKIDQRLSPCIGNVHLTIFGDIINLAVFCFKTCGNGYTFRLGSASSDIFNPVISDFSTSDGFLRFKAETLYGPPLAVLNELSKKYPDLVFCSDSCEADDEIETHLFKNGESISQFGIKPLPIFSHIKEQFFVWNHNNLSILNWARGSEPIPEFFLNLFDHGYQKKEIHLKTLARAILGLPIDVDSFDYWPDDLPVLYSVHPWPHFPRLIDDEPYTCNNLFMQFKNLKFHNFRNEIARKTLTISSFLEDQKDFILFLKQLQKDKSGLTSLSDVAATMTQAHYLPFISNLKKANCSLSMIYNANELSELSIKKNIYSRELVQALDWDYNKDECYYLFDHAHHSLKVEAEAKLLSLYLIQDESVIDPAKGNTRL